MLVSNFLCSIFYLETCTSNLRFHKRQSLFHALIPGSEAAENSVSSISTITIRDESLSPPSLTVNKMKSPNQIAFATSVVDSCLKALDGLQKRRVRLVTLRVLIDLLCAFSTGMDGESLLEYLTEV